MSFDKARYRKANPVTLAGIVQILMNDLGMKPDILFNKLQENWKEIVGEANSKNTRPVSLEDGILTVAVSSPAWNTQARFFKPSFLKNISAFEPDMDESVDDIRFIIQSFDRSTM